MKFSTVLLLLTLLYGTLVSVGGDSSSGDDDNSSGDGDNSCGDGDNSSGDGDNSSGDGDGSSSSSSGDGDNSSGDGDGSSSSSSSEETTTPPAVPHQKCPPDWVPYDDSCYWLMDSTNFVDHKTWPAARQACQDMGADLAKITNNGTNEFVTESLLRNATDLVVAWIGLRTAANQTSVANLTWLDGTHVVYTNWNFDNGNQEPNGEIENDCVLVYEGETTEIIGEWFDQPCRERYNFLCQVTPE